MSTGVKLGSGSQLFPPRGSAPLPVPVPERVPGHESTVLWLQESLHSNPSQDRSMQHLLSHDRSTHHLLSQDMTTPHPLPG